MCFPAPKVEPPVSAKLLEQHYRLFYEVFPLTYSNVYISQRASLRSFGTCREEPYAERIVARHRAEEIAAKRKIDEINHRYEALLITRAGAL